MANRIFELPQTKGSFQMMGIVSGTQSKNFYQSKKTKNNKDFRSVFFSVKTREDGAPNNISMNGMPRDFVYYSRREDKAKGITKGTKKIPFADRYTSEVGDGYRMIGINVGLERKETEDGKSENIKQTLAEFDACKEIADKLRDDMTVFVRGNTDFSTYDGKHRVQFTPNQISLCSKPADLTSENTQDNALFTQHMVFVGISIDKEKNEAVVSAKIVTYSTIEDAAFYIDSDHIPLAKNLKKNVKPYTSFVASGYLFNESEVDEVEQDDAWGDTNKMERQQSSVNRKMYITGVDPSTLDADTYSESNMEQAQAKIIAANNAKNDFGGSSEDWGSMKATSSTEDEDPWI